MNLGQTLIAWILTVIFGSILTVIISSGNQNTFDTNDIGPAILICIIFSFLFSFPAIVVLMIANYLVIKPDHSISKSGQFILFITHLIVGGLTFLRSNLRVAGLTGSDIKNVLIINSNSRKFRFKFSFFLSKKETKTDTWQGLRIGSPHL